MTGCYVDADGDVTDRYVYAGFGRYLDAGRDVTGYVCSIGLLSEPRLNHPATRGTQWRRNSLTHRRNAERADTTAAVMYGSERSQKGVRQVSGKIHPRKAPEDPAGSRTRR